jgi:hypothetical protein
MVNAYFFAMVEIQAVDDPVLSEVAIYTQSREEFASQGNSHNGGP